MPKATLPPEPAVEQRRKFFALHQPADYGVFGELVLVEVDAELAGGQKSGGEPGRGRRISGPSRTMRDSLPSGNRRAVKRNREPGSSSWRQVAGLAVAGGAARPLSEMRLASVSSEAPSAWMPPYRAW